METGARLAIRIAYLGTEFSGWQRQPGERTVQGTLETALERLYGDPVRLTGSGRTDAGVHAAGQTAHFDAPLKVPPAGVVSALNGYLPAAVRVLSCRPVDRAFDARRSSLFKVYRYRLAWGRPLAPWEAQRTWMLQAPPDIEAMTRAVRVLEGSHDFAAFALAGHSGTGARGTRRRLRHASVTVRGRRAAITLEGDGFLRGMARRITGALVEVGRGARQMEWVAALLANPSIRPPAPTAPAHGLTLERVVYANRSEIGASRNRGNVSC